MSVCSVSPKYFTQYPTLPLLLKLIEMGMDPYLIRWTKKLSGRKIAVYVCWWIWLPLFVCSWSGLHSTAQAKLGNVIPLFIHLVEKIGSDHDAAVKEWKDTLLASTHSRNSEGKVSSHSHKANVYSTCLTHMYAANIPYNPEFPYSNWWSSLKSSWLS